MTRLLRCTLVLYQATNARYRALQMRQDKAQSADNGVPLSRAVTQDWCIWRAPFGRAGKGPSAALRLLVRTRPLPARTRLAVRPFTARWTLH